jgi:plasmid maintenance system antidote protein VapI
MNHSLEIVEAVRAKTATRTNYATAKALGIAQNTLNHVLKGDRNLSNKSILKASELLGRDFKGMLILVESDRARSDEEKEYWARRIALLEPPPTRRRKRA